MSSPTEPKGKDSDSLHLEATASGQATVNQAGRDQHFHFGAGVRRTVPGGQGADVGCPYPGLASFTGDQAAWFFGRDRLTASLVSRLDRCLTEGGPVMVVAASGAGKSSLLRAGLLPKVAAGALTPAGSRHWPRVLFTPRAHPMREAAAALLAACRAGGEALAEPSAGDLDGLLAEAVAAAGPGARAVLVVDQFEELFRLCEGENERGAFISWLWRIARGERGEGAEGPAALVACAVRANFYADCTRYPEIRQALQQNQFIVGAMSPDELHEAISCPAEAAGLDIEPGLVELLLADLRARNPAAGNGSLAADDGAARLPLLAHALQATWQERHGSTLTVEGYRAAGGIEHAIADSAEQVFARLDSTAQEEARGLFLRLVKIGNTSGEDVRRPVPRSDLLRGSSIAETVIDAYTARRLLTQSRDAVQISHESLLGAWPRLTAWIDDDRAGQLARQRIEDDAADWDRTRRDPSLLYRGARLETAAEWASRHSTKITDTAGQFLDASRRLARRTRLLRQSGVIILAALALATTVMSVVALQQRSTAIAQRNLAIYNQVVAWASQLAGTNRSTAAQLLLTAYRMPQGPGLATRLIETENEPLSAFVSADGPVTALAASPHGHLLASSSYYGKVSLWDVTSATHPRRLEQGLAAGAGSTLWLAFSPDGDTLATGNNDGTVRLWDITDPARPRQLGGPMTAGGIGVVRVAFSPDGRTLATGDNNSGGGSTGNGTVRLWDITDPARPRELGNALDVGSVAQFALQFSPDGRVLATSYDSSTVRLWDVATPARPRALGQPLSSSNEGVISLAFSPDGHTLATGNLYGDVSLWDVAAPARPRALGQPLSSSNAIVFSLAFSPDGHTLATGDSDSTIGLWDVTDPPHPSELSQPLTVGTSDIFAVSYGPDGHTLYSGNSDGTIGLTTFPSIDLGTGAQVESLASSPRKRILATGNTNGTIDLWDVTQPAHPSELSQLHDADGGGVGDIAFSPDGNTLAGVSNGGTVELWDVRDPSHPRELSQPPVTLQNSPSWVAFSSDGLTLATRDAAGTVTLWDIADPASPRRTGQIPAIGSNDSVYFAAFSPGRRILATGYQYAGAIDLWDVSDPTHPREFSQPLTAGGSDVTAMAFSPDGRILAGSDGDGTVTLWDIADPDHPRELSRPETAGSNTPASLVFSPDGRTLASGSFSGTITLWNITNADHPRALGQPLAVTGAVSSNSLAFSPDSQVLADGNNKGPTLLWDLDPSYAMSRICATTNLTRQDWDKYVSGLPYGPPCGH